MIFDPGSPKWRNAYGDASDEGPPPTVGVALCSWLMSKTLPSAACLLSLEGPRDEASGESSGCVRNSRL